MPCFAIVLKVMPTSFRLSGILITLALIVGPGIVFAQRPLGIDVSDYQGTIDWSSVRTSGVAFAWAKATEGVTFNATTFANNEANARTAGVLIGAYHFARPDVNIGTAGADQEAAHFWGVVSNYVKGGGAYLMPMLDIEQAPGTSYSQTSLSAWVNEWCQDIVNAAAANGVSVHPVVYTYISYASTWLDSGVTQWPLWMANYNGQNPQTGGPNATAPWSAWNVWQYSSTGTVPGISGNCDLDVFNGTSSTLSTLVVGGAGTNPPSILSQPQSLSVIPGAGATFSVNVTGVGPLHFQWRFNQTNIAGANATNYTLPNAQLANAGGYSVAISNAGGTTLSTPAFLSVLAPLSNAPGCILAPPGMVNWWPADGNANDIFSSNNATPYNGFSYATGEQGLAFHFDGSTSYLGVGAPSLATSWTACMWVNRQNAPGSGAALLSDGTYELKLEQYNGTRQVGVTHFGVGDFSFGYIVPAGVWTHLAFVGTSTGTTLYVNGTSQSTLTNTLPLPRGYIGAGFVASGSRFVDFMLGGLDEVLLFNRALSNSEINAIYSAGHAGLCRAPEFTGILPVAPGQFRLFLRGQTGKSFTVYQSLGLPAWSVFGTMANPTGSVQFSDTNATNAQTLYRASQP